MRGVAIEAGERSGIPVLRLRGELTLPGAVPLLDELTGRLRVTNGRPVVCDLTTLEVPGSDAALTLFPAALRRVGGWPDVALHLRCGRPDTVHRLRGLGMQRFLPLHEDLDAAVDQARLEAPGRICSIDLPPLVESPALARSMLTGVWPDRPGRRLAGLVLSELVTNAVEHTDGPCRATVALSASRSLVAVTDRSAVDVPALADPDLGECRGLLLVEQLSTAWGSRLVHPSGKTVWAALPPVLTVPRARPPTGTS